MNWQLCDFFQQGGRMQLNADQEAALLRVRHKLVALHVPFMYETQDEFRARRSLHQRWEPLLRLWRPLTREEMKILAC